MIKQCTNPIGYPGRTPSNFADDGRTQVWTSVAVPSVSCYTGVLHDNRNVYGPFPYVTVARTNHRFVASYGYGSQKNWSEHWPMSLAHLCGAPCGSGAVCGTGQGRLHLASPGLTDLTRYQIFHDQI